MPRDIDELAQMYHNVRELQDRGQYEPALALATILLAEARQRSAGDNEDLAEVLTTVGILSRKTGKLAEAEPCYQEALAMRRRLFGDHHPAVAAVLNSLATLYLALGKHADAERLFLEAIDAVRGSLGVGHQRLLSPMQNLLTLYLTDKRYDEAEELFASIMQLRETLGAPEDSGAIELQLNVASLYAKTTRPGDAIAALCTAVRLARKILSPDHPLLHECLRRLASDYDRAKNGREAVATYTELIAALVQTFGEHHPDVVEAMVGLASAQLLSANYGEADALLTRLLPLARSMCGERHHYVASILNRMGMLRREIGRFDDAAKLFDEALSIARESSDVTPSGIALVMNNLAMVYRKQERYRLARPLLEEARDVLRQDPDSRRDFVTTLINLSTLTQDEGDYDTAEGATREALEIARQSLGEDSVEVAVLLHNLAEVFRNTGREELAEQYQKDSVARIAVALGPEHPRLARGLINLAKIYVHNGRLHEAIETMSRAASIEHRNIVDSLSVLRPDERLETAIAVRQTPDFLLSLLSQHPEAHSPAAVESAFNVITHRKGVVAEIAVSDRFRQVSTADVGRALSPGSALIEFVHFAVRDFAVRPRRWETNAYAAFVIRADDVDNVRFVNLGGAVHIDALIAAWRMAIGGTDGVYQSLVAVDPNEDSGRELTATLFQPLVEAVVGCSSLVIAPDGKLGGVPFEVLPLTDARRVIDAYEVSYVSSGRAVLRTATGGASCELPLVIADPDFDLAEDVNAAEPFAAPTHDAMACPIVFDRLEGASLEGERVAALLGVTPLTGRTALKASITACHSPRILHFATHGYFVPDETVHAEKDANGVAGIGVQMTADMSLLRGGTWSVGGVSHGIVAVTRPGRLAELARQGPLWQSGLVLAGANTWLRDEVVVPEAENGLLSAADIARLDLSSTRLVVLSACETGLGHVERAEGVLGLARSCLMAGAATVIVSLWKIPDAETLELMDAFYRRALAGERIATALQNAKLSLKFRYADPSYWGSFICYGDPSAIVS